MDVVDLSDFVQLFGRPKRRGMTSPTATLESETKPRDVSSSSSSITLPLPACAPTASNDLEKMATNKSAELGSTQPMGQAVTALDWTGPDDPDNPENWPAGKKAFHIAYIGLQCFVVYAKHHVLSPPLTSHRTFGSSVYTPAIASIVETFDVSPTAATLPLTVYVLGLALGPAISAPISETHGRRIVYLTLFPIALLFTLGAGLAKSFATLMVCRFLAGTIGSGGLAVGAGTNSDLFPPLTRAPVASVFLLAPFAGPALGPVAGSYLVQFKSWRWTQYITLMIGLVAVILGFFQKETYKKIILAQRAKRLNLPPPPNPMASMTAAQKAKFVLTVTIARPVIMLLTEPIVAFLAIYTAFNFGVLFCFFAAFPIVFESRYPEVQAYHFTQGESGLVFLGIGVGILLAAIIFIISDKTYYQPRARKEIESNGKDPRSLLLAPENRVLPAVIGSVLLPIGLFWFAWTAKSSVHWIVPVLASIFFGAGNLLVFFTAVMYQLDSYGPMMGASAMAANGILRYVFGAVFPLFSRQMYLAMGAGWATSLLGFVTVALMPVPWILFKYGAKIRSKSKYAMFSREYD
ncbi:hypothetical protein OHC33_006142 [Knufia fluminis]|uniref:Major facilitator superfamily (MFS) profile domain-containing protein n=1 Tax=Knufia fluminis TaxID=191047 RepID=A0AAN8EFN3_9EURO|nr:hypothetical protein OHC33_006142 [Knufia fluminis]